MNCGIDNLHNHANWQRLYNLLPLDNKTPFFCPQYYQVYIEVENHPAECFWMYKDDKNFLFYPYLKKSINALGYNLIEDWFDISGAYNYNGPLGVVEDRDFLALYNKNLQEHLISEKVVTEYVRYSPIPENHHFHSYPEHINVLDNIFVDLSKGIDYLWTSSYEKNLRTSIRKGASYGLNSVLYLGKDIDNHLIDLFYGIYQSTMQRNQADEFYYFNLDFIRSLCNLMQDKVILIITYLDGVPISFEFLICDGVLTFALLGGTLSEYYRYNPNAYQKNEMFVGLIENNYYVYSMGGGLTRRDSLYSYKKSFAKTCENPFYIGTYIYYEKVYNEIIKQWENKVQSTEAKRSIKLQRYRDIV